MSSPTSTPTAAGIQLAPGTATRHQRHDDRDHGRAEQVAFDLASRRAPRARRAAPRRLMKASARAVGTQRQRQRGVGRGHRRAPDPGEREQHEHEHRTVTALEQPAVDRDRAEHDNRVAGVGVGERRHQQPPPQVVSVARPELDRVRAPDERRPPEERSSKPGQDQRDRRVGTRLTADPGDLAAAQTGQRGARRPTLTLADAAVAVELRGPLAQPAAAVRAFGDVRADLGLAVLANYEQVRAAGAHRVTDCMTAARSRTDRDRPVRLGIAPG